MPADDTCMYCNVTMPATTLRIKKFGGGIFAVDSVVEYTCPTGTNCPSGGGYQTWQAVGKLHDLAGQVTKRPLFAKYNPSTEDWEVCLPPGID